MKIVLLLSLVFLGGCAGLRGPTAGATSSEARRIQNVPFFPDDTDQCGPSTLASILNFAGQPTAVWELRNEIYSEELEGTLPMDLLPAVEERGMAGRVFNGSLDQLKAEIRDGRPVLAYLNLGLKALPQGHYVVVTGYDDDRGGVYAHDGRKAHRFIAYKTFLRGWNKTDRWALSVYPRAAQVTTGRS